MKNHRFRTLKGMKFKYQFNNEVVEYRIGDMFGIDGKNYHTLFRNEVNIGLKEFNELIKKFNIK